MFYEIELGKISESLRKSIQKNKSFDDYGYFLTKIWQQSAHRLTTDQEKIMSLKAEPAYTRWTDGSEKLISQQTIVWKKQIIPIHQAIGMIGTLQKQSDRRALNGLIMEKLKSISYFIEHELNAIVTNKKIDDELRGFTHPYSATILDYENTETEIELLMKTIKDQQKIAHKLYSLKKQLMGVDELYYADLSVTLSARKSEFSFEQGVDIIRRAFGKIDPVYVEIFDRFLENGQIDVYPRTGKKGGGYCCGGYGHPTYVLLNWTNDLHSVTTLAHEMGHAFHRELSKSQHVLYESHPISTAEVASTLFENFVFDEIMETLSPRDRIYAQFNRLQDTVATVFRQGAYVGFELDMHHAVAKSGFVSADGLAHIMYTNLKKHLGNAFQVTPDDGYLFVRYMHSRWFFYSYSYAYGQLISTMLYHAYQRNNNFREKIYGFLSSGGKQSPADIFAACGLNTTEQNFWKTGILNIAKDIKDFEKQVKEAGL